MSKAKNFQGQRPVIGMVHLGPLPGSPRWRGDWGGLLQQAKADATALAEGGADGVAVENFGDVPFFKDRLPPETIAALTRCAWEVRSAAPKLLLGINALRNDGLAALGVAAAVGAQFVRVNVLVGAMVTDQGIIEGCAASLLRKRAELGLESTVRIFADVAVKHAAPLAPLDPDQLVHDTLDRGLADALIVSGSGTGRAPDVDRLARVRELAASRPVLVGSGATAQNVASLYADGYIVGTSLKTNGTIDAGKVRAFVQAVRKR